MKPFLVSLILDFWKGFSIVGSLVHNILLLRYFPKIHPFLHLLSNKIASQKTQSPL